jgi:predicted dehydrogenase
MTKKTSRRTFLAQSGSVLAVPALSAAHPVLATGHPGFHVAGRDEIKVALIGSGGRGSGAADQIMNTKGNTRLVAIADPFTQNARRTVEGLKRAHPDKVDVPEDRIFGELDGYKHAIDAGVDLVVIATPPGFKPQQFEYAVQQGKHVFMEKPVAVDAPGVRRVLAANEVAKQKNLMVGIGLQRRHEQKYIDCVQRLQGGAIGDINLLRVYWNGGGIWYRNREPGMSEMQFQINNWYHFIWVCGDQICEQHIHNIDVGCWVKDMYPVEANGMGGGEQRVGGDRTKSQIFDHTFVEFTFPDGTKMFSQGRHLGGESYKEVAEFAHGSKGVSNVGSWIEPFGEPRLRIRGEGNGHQQEQHDLVEALMRGEIYNEGDFGAKSTFAAILGREACYSGRVLKWDELLAKGRDYCPGIDQYTLESDPPAMPGADGRYWVPVPGEYDPFA